MKKLMLVCSLVLLTLTSFLKSNNIQIDTLPILVDQDTTQHFCYVKFDLSWDNSWRVNASPNNWDAAWLFVKYRINTGVWKHATLDINDAGFSMTNDNGVPATFKAVSDGKGVYVYRANEGSGSNNWDGVKLKWNYGTDTVPNNAIITVKVFAIEMVYVPQGSYYLGSGGTEPSHFYQYPNTNSTFHVTSEDVINIGTTTGNLYYTNDGAYPGDFTGTLPASYPKGFKAFYSTKYEVTEEQYAEFLNTLTPAQQSTRYLNVFNQGRNYIKAVNGVYGCDGNNNNILNELNDGQNIGCNYLCWGDVTAYCDWACLRPMTELEYEKACRGTASPVANEFAWGTATVTQATGIVDSKTISEIASPAIANCVYGNQNNVQGPLRVGNFARSASNRAQAGASFWGILDLSGNNYEQTISVGHPTGRSFTGLNGDGYLTSSGYADVTNWPGANDYGSGVRGGSWGNAISYQRLSDRYYACAANTTRSFGLGLHCVRSAE
jgi:formylglycine-generating enzyme required for sulfatase activity